MSTKRAYYIPLLIVMSFIMSIAIATSFAYAHEDESATSTDDHHAEEMEDMHDDMADEMDEHMDEEMDDHMNDAAEAARERQAERREEASSTKEEKRLQMEERVRDRVTHLMENIKAKMNAAIDRLRNIGDRLESRIEKLEEQGVDGTEARAHLETARTELQDAWDIINGDIYTNLYGAVSAANPANNIRVLHGNVSETNTHIRNAHKELIQSVAALKSAIREAGLDYGVSGAVRSDESLDKERSDHDKASSTNASSTDEDTNDSSE
jgi:hypothetical protein